MKYMDNNGQTTVPEESVITPDGNVTGGAPVAPVNNTTVINNNRGKTSPIIKTIFGLLLLIGAIGAGVALVGKQQLLNQQAGSTCCAAGTCTNNTSYQEDTNGSDFANCGDRAVQACKNLGGLPLSGGGKIACTSAAQPAPATTTTTTTGTFNQAACSNYCKSAKTTVNGGAVDGRQLTGGHDGNLTDCECFCSVGNWTNGFGTCDGGQAGTECTSGQTGVRNGVNYTCVNGNWIPATPTPVSGGGGSTGAVNDTQCSGGNNTGTCASSMNCNGTTSCTLTRSSTCSNMSGFSYFCPGGLSGGKCLENRQSIGSFTGGQAVNLTSFTRGNNCGAIQVDFGPTGSENGCGVATYVMGGACTTAAVTAPPAPTNPPAPGGPTAQCTGTRAYDSSFNLLTSTQLSALQPGDHVLFAVTGTTSSGIFDKARFTINGVLRPDVTAKIPATGEFYDDYVIPTGVTAFNVTSQIHHAGLNAWY